jgi:peroxiredoxin
MKYLVSLLVLISFSIILSAQEMPEGLFIGSKAPNFKLKDQDGQEIRLKDKLKKGKVVLIFYRGYWCPYCMKELLRFQDSLQYIQDKGATVLAISPENNSGILSTKEKIKAGFSLLQDSSLAVLKKYGVGYGLSPDVETRYRNSGIDLTKINASTLSFLPVPAVYIIDKEANVTYRYFEPDYKKRPSVKSILENL